MYLFNLTTCYYNTYKMSEYVNFSSIGNVNSVKRTININGMEFTINDIKVVGRIDDKAYKKNWKLWEKLPRCFVHITYEDNERVICALRKFGSEDEFNFNNVSEDQIVSEFYTNKANGEYFSFSTINYQDIDYGVTRSKNVTMIFRLDNYEEDLELDVYSEQRYPLVKEMTLKFMEKFESFDKKKLIELCYDNTISLEACSPERQHLVDYDGDYRFIAFSITTNKPSSEGLTSFLPDEAKSIFEDIGLDTLPYVIKVDYKNKTQRDNIREKIYNEDNSEGAVVYKTTLDKNGKEIVFKTYKFKNYRYVFWRAVREKLRAIATIDQLKARLNNLYCDIPFLPEMIEEAISFYCYAFMTISSDNWNDLFSQWVTYMKKFNSLTNEEKEKYRQDYSSKNQDSSKVNVVTIGIPGTGKSTILKILEILLPNAKRINQDECGGKPKRYHDGIKKLTEDNNVKITLLDKCHHNSKIRADTIKNTKGDVIYIVFYHPDDFDPEKSKKMKVDNMINESLSRIGDRNLGHHTLIPSFKLGSILEGFKNSYEYLTKEEDNGNVVYVNIMENIKDNIMRLLGYLDTYYKVRNIKSDIVIDEAKINEAIKKVLDEEKEMDKKNQEKFRVMGWFADVLDYDKVMNNKQVIQVLNDLVDNQKMKLDIKTELHATLLFHGKKLVKNDINNDKIKSLVNCENDEFELEITHIAYDHKIAALRVIFPDNYKELCQNKHPHLTLALTPKTSPVYSNDMLENPNQEIELEPHIKVNTKINKYYMK